MSKFPFLFLPLLRLKNSLLLFLVTAIAASLGGLVYPAPTEAADFVILKYSVLRESVSVKELSLFAETGEMSSSLRSYLKMANQNPDEVRQALNDEVEVDPVTLSRILNSYPGEFLLDQVSEVIHTPSHTASRQSLRGALVTSALEDRNIRLIEVLENYPTPEVHLEGDRLLEVYNTLDGVMSKIPNLPIRL